MTTTTRPTVEFDSYTEARYEFTHGTRPRGLGCWLFDVELHHRGGVLRDQVTVPGVQLYSAAKRQAVKLARALAVQLKARRAVLHVCT